MAKTQGPEEFFEVFRKATSSEKPGVQEPEPSPPPEREQARPPEPPAAAATPEQATTSPAAAPPGDASRFPMSVFAEQEPTVTLRRSTLIFALILFLVLLFIAYALGRRARAPAPRPSGEKVTVRRHGMEETRTPVLPQSLRNKYAVYMEDFDHRKNANVANALAVRDTLRGSPEAEFIGVGGKDVFILSYDHRLHVCVGPFDTLTGPGIDRMLPRLRALSHNGMREFAAAPVRALPPHARLFEPKE